MIKVQDIQFAYKGGTEIMVPNIDLAEGEHALVLGQSGCGKTTLLHLMAGLLKPQAGTISVGGTDLSSLKGSTQDRFRGQNIGIVFQKPHFISSVNVVENVALAASLAGKKLDNQAVVAMLETLGLKDKINSKVTELSEGEKQRVSIARALIVDPVLILADEPTSALDDANCQAVLELLKSQATANKASLIIVTHDNRLKDQFTNKIEL